MGSDTHLWRMQKSTPFVLLFTCFTVLKLRRLPFRIKFVVFAGGGVNVSAVLFIDHRYTDTHAFNFISVLIDHSARLQIGFGKHQVCIAVHQIIFPLFTIMYIKYHNLTISFVGHLLTGASKECKHVFASSL